MINDFHLQNATTELISAEERCSGIPDVELWNLALDDYLAWLVRPN